jgi:hypothetical protein
MAYGWFLVPYKLKERGPRKARYCAMDDYTADIAASGGAWSETEILGDQAVVKVKASEELLAVLGETFVRLPGEELGSSLSSLSSGEKDALKRLLTEAGYSLSEVTNKLGSDLGQKSLGDVLRFLATKRRKPRYDKKSDMIVLDGPEQVCRSIDDVDEEVK